MILSDDYGSGLYDGGGIIEDGCGYGYGYGDDNGYGDGYGYGYAGTLGGNGIGDGSWAMFNVANGDGICDSEDDDAIFAIPEEEEKP